jgi:hypothetical protein
MWILSAPQNVKNDIVSITALATNMFYLRL